MLPTTKTKHKQSLSDLTALIYGPSKIGKCLKGDTLIYDPASGRPRTLGAMVAERNGDVHSLGQAGTFHTVQPSAYLEHEPAQLYRVLTQSGRSIEATAEHPFLTREGWKPLQELTLSDRVAIVARSPRFEGRSKTDSELIKILAYLLADGNLRPSGSPVFTKIDPEVRMDFESAVEAKGDECVDFVNAQGVHHVRIRGKRNRPNNVIAFLKEEGLRGVRSGDKFIPEFVFGLRPGKLALFLNRLFSCDGSVEASGRVSYSSKSKRLVLQVQHLLSRFGIVSLIRDRYMDGKIYGAELLIASKCNVLKFIDEIGFIGEKSVKAEVVRTSLYNVRNSGTQLDRAGDVLFDRIIKIEPTTIEPVFDLTIPGYHNFIANDFIVHNSTWCSHATDALFLATEPGLNSLDVFQIPISRWDDLLKACAEIAEGKHPFKTIIIDTADNAYKLCAEYVCAKHKIDHESDLGYGKGYALINNEFQRVLNKLAFLPYGLFIVSHSQEKEIETRTGKYVKMVPTLPDKARKIVIGLVDIIAYCDLDSSTNTEGKTVYRRVMRTKPSPYHEAGDRTGRLPEVIDLDFQTFEKVFDAPKTTPVAESDHSAKPSAVNQQKR